MREDMTKDSDGWTHQFLMAALSGAVDAFQQEFAYSVVPCELLYGVLRWHSKFVQAAA
jgi:hypothetical protein